MNCVGQNIVEQTLRKYIGDENAFFVFPSETAAVLWAEKALEYGSGAVALERFAAWDTFKAASIRSVEQNRRSVPAVMRKLFAAQLLSENARCAEKGTPLFKSLVSTQYSAESKSFSDWLASLLPPLSGWMKKHRKAAASGSNASGVPASVSDDEDLDLQNLFKRYSEFLKRYSLFEPAWEKPPFHNDGRTYIVFFPEILQDYAEYRDILDAQQRTIIQVHIPVDSAVPEVHQFDNARLELRSLALHIRTLREQGIPYTGMAVNVPDFDTVPYVTRELSLYNIPFVLRTGKPLAEYAAGQLFSLIQSCAATDFSFQSLKNLFLNRRFPWKEQTAEAAGQLIDFGIKNNCLCSWYENGKLIDVWEQAFSRAAGATETRAKEFYRSITAEIKKICSASSFAGIRAAYFLFREKFFDVSLFAEERFAESDMVLSRCLSELAVLIDMENTFPDVKPDNHLEFFVNELRSKEYLPQSRMPGVSIFPYRLAATAPFDCHLTVNAAQNAVSVMFKPLPFLRQDKRDRLQVKDDNVSSSFIRLYAMNSLSAAGAYFSCAQRAFSGYTLPHSFFSVAPQVAASAAVDPYVAEKNALHGLARKSAGTAAFPKELFNIQKEGFERWSAVLRGKKSPASASHIQDSIRDRCRAMYAKNGTVSVSESALNMFFDCPLQWLFNRVLKIEDFSLDASLLEDRLTGTILHEIIHRLFLKIQEEDGKFCTDQEYKPVEKYVKWITDLTHTVLDGLPQSCNISRAISPLTVQLYASREKSLCEKLTAFLKSFCRYFSGYEIKFLEKEYEVPLPGSNVLINGRIDCVLGDTDGNPVIVDFKTKKMPESEECLCKDDELLLNYQLPMYIRLLEDSEYKGKDVVQAALFFSILDCRPEIVLGNLNKEGKPIRKEKSVVNREDFQPTMEALDEGVRLFAEAVESGSFKVLQEIPYDTCLQCAYRSVCRTTFTVSGEKSCVI